MKFFHANIVTAFSANTIGTKVTDVPAFNALLADAVEAYEFPAETDEENGIIKGQGFVMLPKAALATISAGCGLRTLNPDDFVLREYRGAVRPFLKREHAIEATGVAAVVYLSTAYAVDPDVMNTPGEVERMTASGASHVLVAIIAFAGPKAPLTADAFVHNLAGGNANAAGLSGDAIREQATEIDAYHAKYATVAD